MVSAPIYAAIVGKKTFVGDCAENLIVANIAVSSVDRFIAVIFPLRHGHIMKNYGLKVMLIVAWGAALYFPFFACSLYMKQFIWLLWCFLFVIF